MSLYLLTPIHYITLASLMKGQVKSSQHMSAAIQAIYSNFFKSFVEKKMHKIFLLFLTEFFIIHIDIKY